MNNPLLQKAKYYLNESNRLTEELDAEIQYSALLEAVLEELVGTENFLAMIESSPELKKRYTQSALNSIDTQRGELADIPKREAKAKDNIDYLAKRVQDGFPHRSQLLVNRHGEVQPTEDQRDARVSLLRIGGDRDKALRNIRNRTRGIRRATS